MNTEDIEWQVIKFIEDSVHQENPIEIKASTTFADLGMDSMDVVQLLFDAEDAFGIRFDAENAADITSIGAVVTYIAKHHQVLGSV